MRRTVTVTLDRIEEGVAVLVDSDCAVYECSPDLLCGMICENSAFTAVLDGDTVMSLTPYDSKTSGQNSERLRRLFGK